MGRSPLLVVAIPLIITVTCKHPTFGTLKPDTHLAPGTYARTHQLAIAAIGCQRWSDARCQLDAGFPACPCNRNWSFVRLLSDRLMYTWAECRLVSVEPADSSRYSTDIWPVYQALVTSLCWDHIFSFCKKDTVFILMELKIVWPIPIEGKATSSPHPPLDMCHKWMIMCKL